MRAGKGLHTAVAALAGGALLMLSFRFVDGFAGAWVRWIIRPISSLLARATSMAPFPLLECFAMAIACAVVLRAFGSIWRSTRLRSPVPLKKALWGAARLGAGIAAGYLLLWYPVYWQAPVQTFSAAPEQVEALSMTLIQRLNGAQLRFSGGEESLRLAESAVANHTGSFIPEGTAKFARYPEWMRGMGIAGLYAPWTAEAIVNPYASAAALPFTACHELMHFLGVADEGQANIAAWAACQRAGGEAADSADLWALRYAMAALRQADEKAWERCVREMSDPVAQAFASMNGFALPEDSDLAAGESVAVLAGLNRFLGSYDALVGWLVDHMDVSVNVPQQNPGIPSPR